MCTMSVIRDRDEVFSIAFNRDESIHRAAGLPPRVVDGRSIMPIDADSGGTWIAANDRGVVLGILNVNQPGHLPAGRLSRGIIIPSLIESDSVEQAINQAVELRFGDFSPFRLVAIDRQSWGEVRYDGFHATARYGPFTEPLMFTSSGLGDQLVEQPRRILFDQIFGSLGATRTAQKIFHEHRWPNQMHLSVCMNRADARTVSRTTVEIGHNRVDMTYIDLRSERYADSTTASLSTTHFPGDGFDCFGADRDVDAPFDHRFDPRDQFAGLVHAR